MLYHPYSPDLAPWDIFSLVKRDLKGNHYTSDDELKAAVKSCESYQVLVSSKAEKIFRLPANNNKNKLLYIETNVLFLTVTLWKIKYAIFKLKNFNLMYFLSDLATRFYSCITSICSFLFSLHTYFSKLSTLKH